MALFDIAGRSVAVQLRNAMEGRLLLDMAAMPDGLYLLRVTDAGRAGVVRLLHRQ
ncbi:MAG TPA: T9SS type A sorting domain-containing protein [Flavobacteriales bacterium]|nr:T9SS type A sorting domain-containing protein [Flavobacteriales bacterium]